MIIQNKYADQLLDLNNVPDTLKQIGNLTGSNLLRFFATSGNPLFIIGNVAADFSNILFLSDVYGKVKPVGAVHLAFDFVKNFLRSTTGIKFKQIRREYLEHGGAMDYMTADGIRALRSYGGKGLVNVELFDLTLTVPKRALVAYGKMVSYLGEKSEEAFRIAVYEKTKNDLIEKYKKENVGILPEGQDLEDIKYEAVREAREVIDFNQGGEWAKNVDAVAPYFNAGMQGIRRIRQYAVKNPWGFASSMVQAAGMAAGMTALSLSYMIDSVCEDEENEEGCNKKIVDTLKSISDYEKANYHIIFTGEKDEKGEYVYVRIKKLPGLSMITTYAEQLFTKFYLGMRGIDYDANNSTFTKTLQASIPFDPTGLAGKNPLIAASIAYGLNYDTFKGESIFKKPKGWEDRGIKPEAEGINDDNVNNLFKYIAPILGMSPIRTQAMVEKIITSESTNPTISILYAAANGLFGEGTMKEDFSKAMEEFMKNTEKKLVRTTNSKLLQYAEQDKIRDEEIEENTEEYINTTEVYDIIDDAYDSGKTLSNGELRDLILEKFDAVEAENYFNKYNNYIRNRNLDKRLLNIVFERKPKLQALYIYERYGSSFDAEEIKEINNIMKTTNKKISDQTLYYYNKKYKK